MNKPIIFLILILILLSIPLISVVAITLRQDEITPNDEFFTLSISGTPKVELSTWRLTVDGLVDKPLVLTYENFTNLPKKSVTATLKCVEGPSGRAVWGGVQLKYILDLASVRSEGIEIVFYAVDDYTTSITLSDALLDDVLLAYEMNGETLPADHGYPVRLVVPDKAGYKWIKWIERIEVVDKDVLGFWESRGWDDDAELSSFSQWGLHAILLTIGFIFGGLGVISGYRISIKGKVSKQLPEFINAKFHKNISIVYLFILGLVIIYWLYATYILRGNIFYSGHGILAGFALILLSIGVISNVKKLKKSQLFKSIHRHASVFGFIVYTGVIISGLILGNGT